MNELTHDQHIETETMMEPKLLTTTPSFPLESLPSPMRQFVDEGAEAFPAPYELLAIPSLVSLGATIGNSRVVQLKEGWVERLAIKVSAEDHVA